MDLIDGEYEIYAVLSRWLAVRSDAFHAIAAQSRRILLGFSTGDFGRRCAVERGLFLYI